MRIQGSMKWLFPLLVLGGISFGGCGYAVKYDLNDRDIVMSESPKPWNVQVADFEDKRDNAEREKSARKQRGDSDLGDYTYDKQFRGEVAEEITKMLVDHLDYANAFDEKITPLFLDSDKVSEAILDSLRQNGTDGVISGEIEHFYGYYDQNIGRQFLYSLPLGAASGLLLSWSTTTGPMTTTYYWYGPGLVLGTYLESLHERQIEHHVQLSTRLISTTTHEPVWQDSFELFSSEQQSMPGISTANRKYEVVVSALRDAINRMVESLDRAPLASKPEVNEATDRPGTSGAQD